MCPIQRPDFETIKQSTDRLPAPSEYCQVHKGAVCRSDLVYLVTVSQGSGPPTQLGSASATGAVRGGVDAATEAVADPLKHSGLGKSSQVWRLQSSLMVGYKAVVGIPGKIRCS